MNRNSLKVFGMVVTVIGFGATLLSDWVDEQEMKAEIKDEVARAMDKQKNEEI